MTTRQPKYQYTVTMTCGGCSGAVTKALTRLLPPDQFEVDLDAQTVKIFPGEKELPSFDLVTEKIGKTGKAITSKEEF